MEITHVVAKGVRTEKITHKTFTKQTLQVLVMNFMWLVKEWEEGRLMPRSLG